MEEFNANIYEEKGRGDSNQVLTVIKENEENEDRLDEDKIDFDYKKEITNNLELVEEEVKAKGHSFQDKKTIEEIAVLLDKFNGGEDRFNRILMSHVFDFGKLNPEASSIKLNDFFQAYFTTYENLKANRVVLAKDILSKTQRIVEMKEENQKILANDKNGSENGIENHSEVFFNIKTMTNTNKYYKVKIIVEGDNCEEFELVNTNLVEFRKFKINCTNPDTNDKSKVKIILYKKEFPTDSIEEIKVDSFYLSEIFERKEVKTFYHKTLGLLEVEFFWVKSLFDYNNGNIVKFEREIRIGNKNLSILDVSLSQMERPFKSILSSVKDINDKTPDHLFAKTEFEIAEKLENKVMDLSGKNMILWDRIRMLFVRILLFLSFVNMLYRSDFGSITSSVCFFLVEVSHDTRVNYNIIFLFAVYSILVDVLWTLFHILHIFSESPLEGKNGEGSSFRYLSIVCSILIIAFKILYLFTICRLKIRGKVRNVNKLIKKKEITEPRQTISKAKGRFSVSTKGTVLRPSVAEYPYPNYIPMRFESI